MELNVAVSWEEMERRRQAQKRVRQAQRIRRRLDAPTDVEAAKRSLEHKALSLAGHGVSPKAVFEQLKSLVASDSALKNAGEILQEDLLSRELHRIARHAVREAPAIRRSVRQILDSMEPPVHE